MKLRKQNEVVKQRLKYHFANNEGGFNIPKGLPFMKEFLNDINSLCIMVDEKLNGNSVPQGN